VEEVVLDLPEIKPVVEEDLSEGVAFTEQEISFRENSSEIINAEAAKAKLQTVVDILASDPEIGIVLAGSTATVGSPDGAEKLSLERAEALAGLLCELGADPTQITCCGLGYNPHSRRADDLDASGSLIEDNAKLNRCVWLVAADSVFADEFLGR